MINRSLSYEPTREDRVTRSTWARGVGIVYGSILLLLLSFMAVQRFFAEPGATVGAAIVAADKGHMQ